MPIVLYYVADQLIDTNQSINTKHTIVAIKAILKPNPNHFAVSALGNIEKSQENKRIDLVEINSIFY